MYLSKQGMVELHDLKNGFNKYLYLYLIVHQRSKLTSIYA